MTKPMWKEFEAEQNRRLKLYVRKHNYFAGRQNERGNVWTHLKRLRLGKQSAKADSVAAALAEFSDNDLDPCMRYLRYLTLDRLQRNALADLKQAESEIESATALADKANHHLGTDLKERIGLLHRLRAVLSGTHGSGNRR